MKLTASRSVEPIKGRQISTRMRLAFCHVHSRGRSETAAAGDDIFVVKQVITSIFVLTSNMAAGQSAFHVHVCAVCSLVTMQDERGHWSS